MELEALLVVQGGVNLRNDTAHGLLDDEAAWSVHSMYVWWFCLRPVIQTGRSPRPRETSPEGLPAKEPPAPPAGRCQIALGRQGSQFGAQFIPVRMLSGQVFPCESSAIPGVRTHVDRLDWNLETVLG
jgi:hypothetical protein